MDQPKKQPVSPSSSWHDEGFDFELTDFNEARRILDSGSLSQFDVAAVMPPEHWEKLRRRKVPTDRALTGRAIDWLLALPATLRPQNLSLQFPRITNALAEVWPEPERCQAALDELLCDGRKGRQGFPVAAHQELVALRSCLAERESARPEPCP
jgi:hypothetical protein